MKQAKKPDQNIGICMCTNFFHPHFSGAGSQALRLSKALRDTGFSILIITSAFGDEPRYEEYEGIRVYRVRRTSSGILALVWYWLQLCFLLLWLRSEYDIIHVHGANIWQIIIGIYGKLIRRKTLNF